MTSTGLRYQKARRSPAELPEPVPEAAVPGAMWFWTQALPRPRRLPSAAAPPRSAPRAAEGPVSPQGCSEAMHLLPAIATPTGPNGPSGARAASGYSQRGGERGGPLALTSVPRRAPEPLPVPEVGGAGGGGCSAVGGPAARGEAQEGGGAAGRQAEWRGAEGGGLAVSGLVLPGRELRGAGGPAGAACAIRLLSPQPGRGAGGGGRGGAGMISCCARRG